MPRMPKSGKPATLETNRAQGKLPGPQTKLDWPNFKPLLQRSDLCLTTILASQILVIKNLWTPTLCKKYVRFLQTLSLTTTTGKPKKGDALRVNDRFQVMDAGFANQLWSGTALKELVCNARDDEIENVDQEQQTELWGGEPIALNPSIRIYRYSKGQYFDRHYDESNVLHLPTEPKSTPVKTTWTLLLYLTSSAEGCKGGETVFYSDDRPGRMPSPENRIVVSPETGMALLHKHGDDCMLHESQEVLEGEKWVIRTDLCVRR